MKRLAGALAIAALAVIGVGCGNDEQNDYVDEVNRAADRARRRGHRRGLRRGADQPAGRRRDRRRARSRCSPTAPSSSSRSSPPEEVADLHEQLVKQIDGIAEQVGAAEEAFTSGNAEEASQAALALQEASNQIQTDLNGLIDQIN